MCKYRYEFFSYCGHQTFYLFDYCDHASIKAGVPPNSSTTAYSDLSEEPLAYDNQSARLSSEEVDLPEILNQSPSSSHSVASIQYSTDTREMSSKNLKSSISSKVFKDSARILETCYKALEQSTNNESRQQPSMEGSPGYRSISRHAFEERLRFFESAVASPNTDISDTLSRFTYDSNTDTLYSLDLQLKRILEKAQILDHASPEKSTKALSDLSNALPQLKKAGNDDKVNKEGEKNLQGTVSLSPRRNGTDIIVTSKASSELAEPVKSTIASREKYNTNGMPYDIAHGVVRSPKALETRNTRKNLPLQWLSRSKKTNCHDSHKSPESESNSPTKRIEQQIPHSPSRKEASKTPTIPQAHKDSALAPKTDRFHTPSSPITSKAPNLRTAERAAARGLKRGRLEMTSGSPPKDGRIVMNSRCRHIRDSTLSSLTVEHGSTSSPLVHQEVNNNANGSRKNKISSNKNCEGNFTFSASLSSRSPIQSEHRRRKSSITSNSSTNPVFYSAPQSPSKLQTTNLMKSPNHSGWLAFDFSRSTEVAASTERRQKILLTENRGSDELNGNESVRGIPQSQNSPRKRPKLRVQTSFVQLHAAPRDKSNHSAALLEGSSNSFFDSLSLSIQRKEYPPNTISVLMDSIPEKNKLQSSAELAQVEDAREISSCTAEPSSSITPGSQDSWQSCPMIKERSESDAREVVHNSFDNREPSIFDYEARKPSINLFALAAGSEEISSTQKRDEEKIPLQPSELDPYPNNYLSIQSSVLNETTTSCFPLRTLQPNTCRMSPEGPMIRDHIRRLRKEPEDRLFINPAIIIRPKGAENKEEEKIAMVVHELPGVESEIKDQLAEKAKPNVMENKKIPLGSGERKELSTTSDMGKLIEPIVPDMHASFASQLKATAPDFIPQNIHTSGSVKLDSEAQEHTDGAFKKVEPFAYQMDLLSAQLEKQAIDPEYALYDPFFDELPQFNPFYMPFSNTYGSLPGSKRHWHKYKGKKRYNKAKGGRVQQCHSPVPSIGAFRNDENSSQWISNDSTVAEQLNDGIDESNMPPTGGSDARQNTQGEDKKSGRKIRSLSFESSASPKIRETRDFANNMNRYNDYVFAVEPCNKIIVEKASEHVGGLPCRTCYPDHPA